MVIQRLRPGEMPEYRLMAARFALPGALPALCERGKSSRMRPVHVGLLACAGFLFCSPVGAATPPRAVTTTTPTRADVRAYAHVLHSYNPQLPKWQSEALASHVLNTAVHWHLDANVLVALVSVESSWNTQAQSWAGAIGLGQLMPTTAARLGVNPRNPYQNISGAARYLRGLLNRFRGKKNRYTLAFAAYNAGPRAVVQYGGVPPYAETQNYVVKVERAWRHVAAILHLRPTHINVAPQDAAQFKYWTGE